MTFGMWVSFSGLAVWVVINDAAAVLGNGAQDPKSPARFISISPAGSDGNRPSSTDTESPGSSIVQKFKSRLLSLSLSTSGDERSCRSSMAGSPMTPSSLPVLCLAQFDRLESPLGDITSLNECMRGSNLGEQSTSPISSRNPRDKIVEDEVNAAKEVFEKLALQSQEIIEVPDTQVQVGEGVFITIWRVQIINPELVIAKKNQLIPEKFQTWLSEVKDKLKKKDLAGLQPFENRVVRWICLKDDSQSSEGLKDIHAERIRADLTVAGVTNISAIREVAKRVSKGRSEFSIYTDLAGGDLKSILPEPLQVQVFKIAKTLCGTVQQMHENGVYHKDIKLQNVLESKGRYFLTDFGESIRRDEPTWVVTGYGPKTEEALVSFDSTTPLNQHPYFLSDLKKEKGKVESQAIRQKANDWWQLGVMLLQILNQKAPLTWQIKDELAIGYLRRDLQSGKNPVSEEIDKILKKNEDLKGNQKWGKLEAFIRCATDPFSMSDIVESPHPKSGCNVEKLCQALQQ